MAWIESHQELARHPKTRRMARLLGVSLPTVIGHLHLMWWWALDYAGDGNLAVFSDADLADACQWAGDAATFVTALIDSGFVDTSHHIHDWNDYTGRLMDRRRENAARKRMSRERPEDIPRTSSPVTIPSQSRHRATGPNSTGPNSTEPNSTEPNSTEPNSTAAAKRSSSSNRKKPERTLLGTGDDLLARFSEADISRMRTRFPGLDLAWEAAKCVDYHVQKTGGSGNWKLAFRNWLETAMPRQGENNGTTGNGNKQAGNDPISGQYESWESLAARSRTRHPDTYGRPPPGES